MATELERQRELETYERNRDELIAKHGFGKYVVIHAESIRSAWETYEDALKAGYSEFGVDRPFMVKKLEEIECKLFFSPSITCQS